MRSSMRGRSRCPCRGRVLLPVPEEWLDGFNTFSIYQVLPQIIELWGLNTQTDVQAKKNFVRLTGK